jgi:hypothetical protein
MVVPLNPAWPLNCDWKIPDRSYTRTVHLNEKGVRIMRKTLIAMIALFAVALLAAPPAMAKGPNGTGSGIANAYHYFYQWLRDDDGDGIPNCLDPDYVKPEDGTGYGKKGEAAGGQVRHKYDYGNSNRGDEQFMNRYRSVPGECKGTTTRNR